MGKTDETFCMGEMDKVALDSLRVRICQALKKAESENRSGIRAQTLRLVDCALSDRDVLARSRGACSGCDEAEIKQLLETMVDQRRESAAQYDEAGRIGEAEREREEIEIIAGFLPRPLIGDELARAAAEIVSELKASKLTDIGRCMTALRARYPGQIECGPAGKAVRAALG